MHQHHIAHLDISLRNILTDNRGHYSSIDYELSRRFDSSIPNPRIHGHRATEVPPEFERGEAGDPYKADVWALAVLILRACQVCFNPIGLFRLLMNNPIQSTGFHVPELLQLTRSMLHDDPDKRPSASMVQRVFDSMIPTINEARLRGVYGLALNLNFHLCSV